MRYIMSLIVIFILFICSMPVRADTPVLLYYYERVPYAVADNQGNVSGLCATPTANAFNQAGISFKWKKMPFKRQVATIKHNKTRAFAVPYRVH